MSSTTDGTNPFNNIIQLEEITHFQRDYNNKPQKSILSLHKSFKGPKKVSYANHSENGISLTEEDDAEENENSTSVSSTRPTTSSYNCKVSREEVVNPSEIFYYKYNDESDSGSLTESESDIEFNHERFIQKKNGNVQNQSGFSGGTGGDTISDRTISDENLFPIPSISVTRVDLVFAFIVFFINFGELWTDFLLAIWHFQTGQKWACGLTSTFIALGGLGMLHQFGLLQQEQLVRLFRRGKRVRILVNCFPPAATMIVSFQGVATACRARQDPMQSQQYFKIDELSRSLSRVQSFFQAAPQATLQLIILMENLNETSWDKAIFTLGSIVLSLCVMTNANLPSKLDSIENNSPSKAAYIPITRIFVGLRMFSSLGSRCMALTYLFVACGCLLYPEGSSSSTFSSTMTALSLLLFPRLVFTLTDYFTMKSASRRNLEHYREQPEIGISSSHPIAKIPFLDAFVGYLATIFFPVGDPLWLFWYLWCESGIFVIFGNVAGITHNCLDSGVNGAYTTVFFVVFIIVPFVVPYAKAVVQKRKADRFTRILQIVPDNSNNIDNLEVTTRDQIGAEDTPEETNNYFSTNDNSRNIPV